MRARLNGWRDLAYRLRTEPVMLAGFALVLIQGYAEATQQNLGGEDLVLYLGQAALLWMTRALVVPTSKIEGSANFIEPTIEKPLGSPIYDEG